MSAIKFIIFLFLVLGLFSTYVQSSFESDYFVSVASDRSGKNLVVATAGGIYTSRDFGSTWKKTNTCGYGSQIASSSDGQYLFMSVDINAVTCGGNALVSNDFGETWSGISFLPKIQKNVRGASISENGQYMAAANFANGNGYDEIYMSSDFGAHFSSVKGTDSISLTSIAMSGSGQKIFVGQGGGILFGSNDFGQTFGPLPNKQGGAFYSLSCSNQCEYILGGLYKGVSISTDGGTNWNTTVLAGDAQYHTALSSNGQYQIAVAPRKNIQVSSDYGTTWVTTSSPRAQWSSAVSDSTGQYMAATSTDDGLYLSSNYGASWKKAI